MIVYTGIEVIVCDAAWRPLSCMVRAKGGREGLLPG